MSDLIVVGMRYQKPYAKLKPTVGTEVFIIKEPSNAVNKNAVAVHIPENNEVCHEGNRIGYIRDVDLHKAVVGKYKIDRIYPNYLRIVSYKAEYPFAVNTKPPTGYLSSEGVGYLTNPCSEYIDSSFTYEGSLNNGDAFVATMRNPRDEANERAKAFYAECKTDAEKDSKIRKYAEAYGANQTKPTEKTKMNFNTNSMRNSFFREISNVAMDMQTGKLGVVTSEGIITATDDGVSVNPITEMGFKIPAFAMRVPVSELTKGDIIIGNGDPVFFIEGSKVGYMTVNTSGVIQETGSVANMFFGKNTVMAVKNMFGSADGKEGSMNPMFMLAMMGDDVKGSGSSFGFKEMMMMQMMSGGKGMGEMNPMFMMMLMSKDK